jgi:hypothetical protein
MCRRTRTSGSTRPSPTSTATSGWRPCCGGGSGALVRLDDEIDDLLGAPAEAAVRVF